MIPHQVAGRGCVCGPCVTLVRQALAQPATGPEASGPTGSRPDGAAPANSPLAWLCGGRLARSGGRSGQSCFVANCSWARGSNRALRDAPSGQEPVRSCGTAPFLRDVPALAQGGRAVQAPAPPGSGLAAPRCQGATPTACRRDLERHAEGWRRTVELKADWRGICTSCSCTRYGWSVGVGAWPMGYAVRVWRKAGERANTQTLLRATGWA